MIKCANCDIDVADGQFCPECGALCSTVEKVKASAGVEVLPPGHLIMGKYRVEQVLQSGSMNLYRGSIGEQAVIIKEMLVNQSPDAPATPDAEQKAVQQHATLDGSLKSEFEVFNSVQSDGLVKPRDHFVDNGSEYLVAEWPAGEKLSHVLSAVGVDEDTSVEVAIGLCEAAGSLHKSGYVHLDIEPSNIFLHEGQVKLLTSTRSRNLDTDCRDCLTTDGYSAPELSKEATVLRDGGPDIYSIGAVLYTLLTGRVLPPSGGQMQVLPNVSQPELARILLQCVAAKPELRYKTTDDVRQRLLAYRTRPKTNLRPDTAILSDVGMIRQNNEDCGLAFDFVVWRESQAESFGLYVVADGMGGERGGEAASSTAISEIWRTVAELLIAPVSIDCNEVVKAAIEKANKEIYVMARDNPALHGMGTTVTLGLRRGLDFYLGHVGDSRAYLIREGKIQQLTEDHSVVSNLLKAGMITAAEAKTRPDRGVITRSLGGTPGIVIDSTQEGSLRLQEGDALVFCTDGLVNNVADDLILAEVSKADSAQGACHQLVSLANRAGGDDNVTVIVVKISL